MICIKNGTLHTAVTRETFVADILIDNGKSVPWLHRRTLPHWS